MNAKLMVAVAVFIGGSVLTGKALLTQQTGSKRTDLQRRDLSAAGREAIQSASTSVPGTFLPNIRIPVKRSSTSLRASWPMRSATSHQ